jgi:putative acetyltransferase
MAAARGLSSSVTIRPELPTDLAAVRAVVHAAFQNHPQHQLGSEPVEPAIVDRLRATGALTVSLVAEEAGDVIGHIALSRVLVNGADEGWYGLGPLAVRPDRQRQGIGGALLGEGVARLRVLGAGGVVLVGEPEYYTRFGFRADSRLSLAGLPPEYFLCLPLAASVPIGVVTYDPAFSETEPR